MKNTHNEDTHQEFVGLSFVHCRQAQAWTPVTPKCSLQWVSLPITVQHRHRQGMRDVAGPTCQKYINFPWIFHQRENAQPQQHLRISNSCDIYIGENFTKETWSKDGTSRKFPSGAAKKEKKWQWWSSENKLQCPALQNKSNEEQPSLPFGADHVLLPLELRLEPLELLRREDGPHPLRFARLAPVRPLPGGFPAHQGATRELRLVWKHTKNK